MQQDHCIITLDLAVYAKAIEIVWKQEAEFNNVVLWMGAFHICTMFLAVLVAGLYVSSLYTNIRHQEGMYACRKILDVRDVQNLLLMLSLN